MRQSCGDISGSGCATAAVVLQQPAALGVREWPECRERGVQASLPAARMAGSQVRTSCSFFWLPVAKWMILGVVMPLFSSGAFSVSANV